MKKILSVFLVFCFVFGLCGCSLTKNKEVLEVGDVKKSVCTTYTELSNKGEKSTNKWRDGMVSGNGLQGVVTSGSPYNDTLTYQNIHFIMPNEIQRTSPDTSDELETVKQAVINGEDITDDQSYDAVYTFHPGSQLRLTQEKKRVKDYLRTTDFETAEISVEYTDKDGSWNRKTFTSQSDGATITKIDQSSTGKKVNMTLSIDGLSNLPNFGDGNETDVQYKTLVDDDCTYISQVAHYPSYSQSELKNGGYSSVTYVVVEGGSKEKVEEKVNDEEQYVSNENPAIKITDANSVYLITISDRTYDMGELSEFKDTENYQLVNTLVDETKEVANKYTTDGKFNYDNALNEHLAIYQPQYNSVEFSLGSDDDTEKTLSNESLIKAQKGEDELNLALCQRAYYSGRYAQLCCSGYTTSRLYGMWTGEWNGGWGSKYTMDANVNLQTSALNSSNMSSSPIGYVNFILRQVDDWEENATATHGMNNAIQAPVNSDGDKALETESCYTYPFRYWNCGASWLLEPIYETWQCYGNIKIPLSDEFNLNDLKSVLSATDDDLTDEDVKAITDKGYLDLEQDVLYPLLVKSANYWDQLMTPEYYTDNNGDIHYEKGKTSLNEGETYCIVPSYSPENNPSNYESPSAANTAMDIAACKSNLEMLIEVATDIDKNADVSKWSELLEDVPPYLYDETGAIKEWACNQFEENNEHRHISHLYLAWPLDETQNDTKLQNAALQAIENRESENDASHALVHRGLICARLKDSDGVTDALVGLMSKKIYYSSLMTNHHTNGKNAYCTDFEIGYTGIVNESLIYSNDEEIEVLPSVPNGWDIGKISGISTKCKAEVTATWNLDNKEVKVSVLSKADQKISIKCGIESNDSYENIEFKNGETKEFVFKLK